MTKRSEVSETLDTYKNRRLTRSAAVQGLSRFASDIIIRGFDTPCKVGMVEGKGFVVENLNYAGVVTRLLQPILPLFFTVQFNFLYEGWRNEFSLAQLRIGLTIGAVGLLFLAAFAATAGAEVTLLGLGFSEALGAVLGAEAAEGVLAFFAEQSAAVQEFINSVGL